MRENKFQDVAFDQIADPDESGLPIAQFGASFAYWLLAHSYFLPGLYLQRYSTLFGLSLATKRHSRPPRRLVHRLLNGTLESTKYFEFDFAWKSLAQRADNRDYLDVFSPWLLPLLLMQRRKVSTATLVNVDPSTLPELRRLLAVAELRTRCEILDRSLDDCYLTAESFDVITSIAGLAQVESDSSLATTMWRLLRPGGRLILSLPCIAGVEKTANGINRNGSSDEGMLPRLYNPQMLQQRIYSVLGEPETTVVYGAIVKRDPSKAESVRSNRDYISPREPIAMARDWRCFSRVEDLPGEGVIAMTFDKRQNHGLCANAQSS